MAPSQIAAWSQTAGVNCRTLVWLRLQSAEAACSNRAVPASHAGPTWIHYSGTALVISADIVKC